ncbi:MAG: protein kinase [Bryobacterales bacterium]|nr:protein kinase [Bryobacterales bacterium]
MNAQEWAQAKEILYAALELPADERQEYLEQACQGRPELLAEISSLVEAHAASSLLNTMGWDSEPREATMPPGTKIGPYAVVEELGRGGMGAVYLALRDDGLYQQQVAIKVVKRGLDSDFILRRFHYERQILAFLNHPYIATMLDGGTTEDGRPYFVMEYVTGQPIVDYVKEQKLNREQRLRLFCQVCEAVAYAHRNLIVHRDLKPANIFVTPDGTPRLLDFGVATLTVPDLQASLSTARTVSNRMLTPSYASPEQFRGEQVTTTSDIYSLGAILYEILTGVRAHRIEVGSYDEIYRVICEQEVLRPSLAVRGGSPMALSSGELRGDLDRIILKALHKEASRRYQSVDQLVEDIGRYLAGRPVRAQDDSWAYRASKFISRHRFSVAASALAVICLVAGLAATFWQARQARIERDRAQRRFNDVRRLATTFLMDHDAIAALPGGTELRRTLITRSLQYLDSLAHESADDISLQRELALAYEKMGDVQGRQDGPNLGDTAAALTSYTKALAIRQAIVKAVPKDEEAQAELARAMERLSGALKIAGNFQEALNLDRRNVEIRERLFRVSTNPIEAKRELAAGYTNLGGSLSHFGDWAGVIDARSKALALYESLVSGTATADDWRGLVLGHMRMASILRHEKQMAAAGKHYQEAQTVCATALEQFPNHRNLRTLQASTLVGLGTYMKEVGKLNEAADYWRRAQQQYAAMLAADPRDLRGVSLLASTHHGLGQTLAMQDKRAEALEQLRKGLELREQVVRLNPMNAGARGEVAESWAAFGDAWVLFGQKDRAAEAFLRAGELFEKLAQEGKANMSVREQRKRITAALAALGR